MEGRGAATGAGWTGKCFRLIHRCETCGRRERRKDWGGRASGSCPDPLVRQINGEVDAWEKLALGVRELA